MGASFVRSSYGDLHGMYPLRSGVESVRGSYLSRPTGGVVVHHEDKEGAWTSLPGILLMKPLSPSRPEHPENMLPKGQQESLNPDRQVAPDSPSPVGVGSALGHNT